MSSLVYNDPSCGFWGLRANFKPLCWFLLKLEFGCGTHFLSRRHRMEVSTAPLSLKYRILWCSISLFLVQGFEWIPNTSSEISKLPKLADMHQLVHAKNGIKICGPWAAFVETRKHDYHIRGVPFRICRCANSPLGAIAGSSLHSLGPCLQDPPRSQRRG